jgi:hypothetical protein
VALVGRKKLLKILLALVLLCLVALAAFYSPVFQTKDAESGQIPVGAVLYLWYGYDSIGLGGRDSLGWNVTGSNSTGGYAVVDEPVKGYYVSDSNSTFSYQVQQMELAGLSYAVVSWWGNASSGRNGAVNNATLDLFKFLKENNSNFKIALMVDAYSDNLSKSSFFGDFNYVYDNFVEPYGNWYFDWQGKPLLLFLARLFQATTILGSRLEQLVISTADQPILVKSLTGFGGLPRFNSIREKVERRSTTPMT